MVLNQWAFGASDSGMQHGGEDIHSSAQKVGWRMDLKCENLKEELMRAATCKQNVTRVRVGGKVGKKEDDSAVYVKVSSVKRKERERSSKCCCDNSVVSVEVGKGGEQSRAEQMSEARIESSLQRGKLKPQRDQHPTP